MVTDMQQRDLKEILDEVRESRNDIKHLTKVYYELKTDVSVLSVEFNHHREDSETRYDSILKNIQSVKKKTLWDWVKLIFRKLSSFWYVYVLFGLSALMSEKKGTDVAKDALKTTFQVLD